MIRFRLEAKSVDELENAARYCGLSIDKVFSKKGRNAGYYAYGTFYPNQQDRRVSISQEQIEFLAVLMYEKAVSMEEEERSITDVDFTIKKESIG